VSRDRQDRNSFNHSPFKSLKGLSVSGESKTGPPAPPSPPPSVSEADSDDPDLFTREMDWLKVRPVGKECFAQTDSAAFDPASPPAASDETSEFLAAVSHLDKTFRDERPPEDEPQLARLRRMKQLERGTLKPAGELDLHGLTRDEAVVRTRAFLGHAVRQGWPAIVIVTGRGLHSAQGPVLRQAVERLLAEARDQVLEWGRAPRRFGGEGALVVFLKSLK
jgi:DNA-nicking Smr family endonuclease